MNGTLFEFRLVYFLLANVGVTTPPPAVWKWSMWLDGRLVGVVGGIPSIAESFRWYNLDDAIGALLDNNSNAEGLCVEAWVGVCNPFCGSAFLVPPRDGRFTSLRWDGRSMLARRLFSSVLTPANTSIFLADTKVSVLRH